MTYEEALREARNALKNNEIFGVGRDVRKLFCHCIGANDGIIRVDYGGDMPAEELDAFFKLIERRAKNEPVSHLIQKREFFGREFEVGPGVLDPRPETETLVEVALERPFNNVLDLGTGSGCVVISIVAEARVRFGRGVWGCGIEVSKEAYPIALRNRERHGLEGPIVMNFGSWFEPLKSWATPAKFDLIVSNPPYIAADEMAGLSLEVLHEPRMALTDEGDGLSCYRIIAAGAPEHLVAGGWLMVEIGPTQGAAVSAMFEAAGLAQVGIRHDLDGRDRVVVGQKPL